MAKKVTAIVKLQLQAGKATPGPPVGSTLGPYGINIPGFTKEFNENASRSRSYQEGMRNRDGKRKAQQGQGCKAYQSPG